MKDHTSRKLAALQWNAARAGAYVWRFQTLPLSRRLAASLPSPFVAKRRFLRGSLAIDLSRTDAHRLLYLSGERFVPEKRLLQSLIRPGARAVDIGANIGYCAMIFAEAVGLSGSVVSIEPDPDNLQELRRNVAANNLGNVSILPFAAGSEDTQLFLKRGLNSTVHSEGGDMAVDVRRLDSLDLGPVHFLKIDVEGYECEVLKGAQCTLRLNRPNLFLELHPDLVPARDDLRWALRLVKSLYSRVSAHREARPSSVVGKAMIRYGGRGPVESTGDAEDWVESAVAAHHAAPMWIVAEV